MTRLVSHKTFRKRSLRAMNYVANKRDEFKLMQIGFRLFLIELRRHPLVILGLITIALSQLKLFRSPRFLKDLFKGKGKHIHLPGKRRRRVVENKYESMYWRHG